VDIIVEIGNSHEGSLGVAKSFVLMAKKSGARTVKFQMHIAEEEGTPDEPFRTNFSEQDLTRQDYWRRVNFSEEAWISLAGFCKKEEIEFLCTPLSLKAASILFHNDLVSRWKVGSGNAVDWPLLSFLVESGLPILISTGLISSSEIKKLKDFLNENRALERVTLMHCVSSYPTSIEHLDMHLLMDLKNLGFRVGYSDHSGSIHPSMYAMMLGAQSIEVHMTPRKDYFGPDVSSSLTPEEIADLVKFAKTFEILQSSNGTKEDHFERVLELRSIFRKGVYWSKDLNEGEIVKHTDLVFLKPVKGLDVVDYQSILGRVTTRRVKAREAIVWEDLNP
jgi:N,N'-diacetyllegionaminate synthase